MGEPIDYKEMHQFEQIDYFPNQGVNYYRIKYIQVDGKIGFSEIKSVNFEGILIWQVFPNPIQRDNVLMIKHNSSKAQTVSIQLIDIRGTVFKEERRLVKDKMEWNLNFLTSGVYLIKILSEEYTYQYRILIY
ncbi:MAG: T9SS type A sorting domain-containing protein [Saprospiraceae bacterium]|nr:T9SS type A sorting domain-containing protein [Saprospiraceae bacterium]